MRKAVVIAIATLVLWGCAKSAPQTAPGDELDLSAAVKRVANDLAQQLGPAAESRTLVIDPLLDHATGQQTNVSARVEEEIRPALAAGLKGVTIVPFNGEGAAKSRLVVTGTIATTGTPDQLSMSVALTDRQTGLVVAQSAARFRAVGFDGAPTPFYNDSPSLVRDRSVDGYLRTSETPAGKPADALYVAQVPTAAVLADALAAYNAGRWDQALAGYNAAASRPDGQQLRTFNGLYLSNMRLGRTDAAEDAFGKIAALGLATNNLSVKLLFRPGSIEFWPDPAVSGAYPMWLRQIARAVRASSTCLNVVGHTSRTGSEAVNDRLSLARATAVRDRLDKEVPGLARQSRVSGVGFRENLIGSGADDASDALDRRVEFKVVACS